MDPRTFSESTQEFYDRCDQEGWDAACEAAYQCKGRGWGCSPCLFETLVETGRERILAACCYAAIVDLLMEVIIGQNQPLDV